MSADSIGKPARYFNAIDGLRLLASVNVVLFHLEGIGGLHDMGGSPGWLFRLIKGPAFHASLFFILGGFIFTTKFAHKAADGSFSSWDFFKKRFKELYPLHFIMTLLMAALYIIKRTGPDASGIIEIPKLLYSLFMHLTFLWSFCPLGTFEFNTPSWALSAMFLCYALFGPLIRWAVSVKTCRLAFLYMALCLIPLVIWGCLFATINTPTKETYDHVYLFFHVFAPIRLFEFVMGMLLARYFMLKKEKKEDKHPWYRAAQCDIMIILAIGFVILNLSHHVRSNSHIMWFSYHVFMIPLYVAMIYAASVERGVFARVLSLKFVQKMGRTSFYPYLMHIPLMSLITFLCEHVWGYRKFLHSPANIVVFMVILYGCSYLYVYGFRNKWRAARRKGKL